MVGTRERSPRFRRLSDWLAWQETLHPSAIDLGLDRMRRTSRGSAGSGRSARSSRSAAPTAKAPASRSSSRILRAAGYRVGTFTSPHLLRYNERIVLDGARSRMTSLVAAFERIDAARGEDTLTYFEFKHSLRLLIFDDAGSMPSCWKWAWADAGSGQRRGCRRRHRHFDRVGSLRVARPRRRSHRPREGGDLPRGPSSHLRSRDMPASIRGVAQRSAPTAAPRSRLRLGRDGDRWSWRGRSSEQRRSAACPRWGRVAVR